MQGVRGFACRPHWRVDARVLVWPLTGQIRRSNENACLLFHFKCVFRLQQGVSGPSSEKLKQPLEKCNLQPTHTSNQTGWSREWLFKTLLLLGAFYIIVLPANCTSRWGEILCRLVAYGGSLSGRPGMRTGWFLLGWTIEFILDLGNKIHLLTRSKTFDITACSSSGQKEFI